MKDTLVINGESRRSKCPLSVSELLVELGLEGKPVVVELNERAVFPRDYPSMMVEYGSKLEIVTLAAGG